MNWEGEVFDDLDAVITDDFTLTVEAAEELLIRIAVRYGTPIGNSQYASQWEGPIGRVADTLAILALDPAFVIPEPTPSLGAPED